MSKPFLIVLGVAMLILSLLFGLPPHNNRFSCIAQGYFGQWTGIWIHHFPERFNGVYQLWDEHGRLMFEHPYKNGLREGKWVEYGSNGVVAASCIYRDGEPWEGICHPFENKVWLGEYRAGKPWNGCLPVADSTGVTTWICFIDGKQVSEERYKEIKQIDPSAKPVGLHSVR